MGKNLNPIEVKDYRAKRPEDATKAFRKDAEKLAKQGYVPVSQSWADGRTGIKRFIMLGGVGSLVFKPAGTLTVTYRLDPAAAGTVVPA